VSVEFHINSGVLSIRITGRFDFAVHGEFREATKSIAAGVSRVEVDLGATEYMDSSALGMLLVMRDHLSGGREAVVIKHARDDVRKILEIANFDKLFVLS
jgi:HptB-dependent secretion and biofilm anti anti-sigma factor